MPFIARETLRASPSALHFAGRDDAANGVGAATWWTLSPRTLLQAAGFSDGVEESMDIFWP
ncbi:hypothetical protein GCM10018785_01060 [Streptomyces longispororuber]|uniref:Uncharacterized protein n=1 Tax=Streptomyces longispororuber TaxID=68230 RepID=A0A918Z3T4_9ACTN|nr:hypothetical protein GCM10018785_01060 [Streptomyces longispororuber]